LLDVHPDGRAYNLAEGIIRAKYRNGRTPEYLQPDQPYEFVIDLWSIAHVFLEGHSVRLDISSANFPRWDRNPNTGPQSGSDATEVAHQKIFHDQQHQSRLVLPILPWD
jgi:putative CocE/NonD family hydrolase